jgi:hypothetical protein
LWPPRGPEPRALEFTIRSATLIQPGEGRRAPVDLTVSSGSIAAVDTAGAGRLPAVPELEGAFVLPGLIDMHAHLPTHTPLRLTELFGILYALHGVTSVRDAGDLDGTAVPAAQQTFERDGFVGPRVFSCGPFIAGAPTRWSNAVIVGDPAEAPEIARRLKREGRVCMKLYDGLDAPRIRALVAAARAEGLTPIGHVPFGLVVENAGVPEVQHLMGTAHPETIAGGDQIVDRVMDWSSVDDARIREVVAASRELGISHTPTLVTGQQLLLFLDYEQGRTAPEAQLMPRMFRDVVWNPRDGLPPYRQFSARDIPAMRATLEKKLAAVRALDQSGVPLFIGTDTQQPFVVPGISVHQEMALFVRAGVPLEKTWQYATTRAAATLPVQGLGRLEPGAPADLAIFRGDPTADVQSLAGLAAVVIRGRLYLRSDLDAALARYLRWYANPLLDRIAVAKARSVMASAAKSDH